MKRFFMFPVVSYTLVCIGILLLCFMPQIKELIGYYSVICNFIAGACIGWPLALYIIDHKSVSAERDAYMRLYNELGGRYSDRGRTASRDTWVDDDDIDDDGTGGDSLRRIGIIR